MSQRAPAKPLATYEDLLRVPDHLVAEILDGELFATPRPAAPHAYTTSRLNGVLSGPFDIGRGGPGGWLILFEPELHLHDDVVVPDLAGWRRERLPSVPDEPFLTLAPDWVYEILSPSTERMDRLQKLRIYARESVKHIWLVNPRLRTLEVLRLEQDRWSVAATHGAMTSASLSSRSTPCRSSCPRSGPDDGTTTKTRRLRRTRTFAPRTSTRPRRHSDADNHSLYVPSRHI